MGEENKPLDAAKKPDIQATSGLSMPETPSMAQPTTSPPLNSGNLKSPTQPQQKPDVGLFIGIASLLFAFLLPIMQMNGVELNWELSAGAYVAIIIGIVWSFLVHVAPHRRKLIRVVWSVMIAVIMGYAAIFATIKQYRRQHSLPTLSLGEQRLIEIYGGIKTNQDRLYSVLSAMLTNPSTPIAQSVAMLDAQQEQLSENRKQLNIARKVISESPVSVQSIRLERANNKALEENTKQEEELQKRRAEIETREAQKLAAIQESNNKEKERRENLKKEQRLAGQSIEVFNYTINRLSGILRGLATDTGRKITFDLPDSPTTFNPNFITDGEMLNASNFVRLGTNSGWEFKIIVYPKCIITHRRIHETVYEYVPAKLSIMCSTKTNQSALSVQAFEFHSDYGPFTMPTNFQAVAVLLSITNTSIIDHRISFSEYRTNIDDALSRLIESQDEQYPLPIKASAP